MMNNKKSLHIDLYQLLDGTSDGAFAVGKDRCILYWNQTAEELLGYLSDEVIGRTCYEIFSGQDSENVGICHRHCPIIAATRMQKPDPNFDARVRTKSGQLCWVSISTFVCPVPDDESQFVIIYLFCDNTRNKQYEQFVLQVLDAAQNLQEITPGYDHPTDKSKVHNLTGREYEVLNLLAQGLGTREIAHALSVSPTTVRNHIQNILRKLGVHSRLQAVVKAIELGFVARN